MATTNVELVTPTRTLYSGEAEMVVCRTDGGEIAFLADHMPYIGALDPFVVRIEGGADELRVAVHGGFVEVKDNQVIMLAAVAELESEIDSERARRARGDAEQRLGSASDDEERAEADAAMRRAEVRLELAGAS